MKNVSSVEGRWEGSGVKQDTCAKKILKDWGPKCPGPDQLHPFMSQILAAFLAEPLSPGLAQNNHVPDFQKGGSRGCGQLRPCEQNFSFMQKCVTDLRPSDFFFHPPRTGLRWHTYRIPTTKKRPVFCVSCEILESIVRVLSHTTLSVCCLNRTHVPRERKTLNHDNWFNLQKVKSIHGMLMVRYVRAGQFVEHL